MTSQRYQYVQLLVGAALAVVVLVILIVESPNNLNQLCELRAGGNFSYLDRPTGELTTMYCEHPNGTIKEVSNLVNSTS